AELLRELVERADVDARHDDVAADAIDEQQREREQNPVPQLGDGEDVLQAVVDCHGNPYAINSAFPPAAWSFSEALPLNLCPRTAVLPLPLPWPRPMRFFGCFMPFGGLRLLRSDIYFTSTRWRIL